MRRIIEHTWEKWAHTFQISGSALQSCRKLWKPPFKESLIFPVKGFNYSMQMNTDHSSLSMPPSFRVKKSTQIQEKQKLQLLTVSRTSCTTMHCHLFPKCALPIISRPWPVKMAQIGLSHWEPQRCFALHFLSCAEVSQYDSHTRIDGFHSF